MSTYKNITKEKMIERINIQNPKLKILEELKEKINPNQCFRFVDKDGYLYSLNYNQLYEIHHAIVKKINPYSIKNIQTYINNNGSKSKVISKEWDGGDSKISVKCEKCGRVYQVRWHHIFHNKKFQCNKCGYSNPYNKKSIESADILCRKHGYNILDGTYKQRKNFCMIDKQGYKYSSCSVYTLNKRNNKFNRFSYTNKYQIENMLFYIKLNNLDIKFANLNQCNVKDDDHIDVYCCECGDIYKATWAQLVNNRKGSTNRFRCHKCSKAQSNLEFIVEFYLKSKNINYTKEKRFKWCKNKRELPFDFYLDDYNTIIEVQGGQHYTENKIFTMTLEEQKERDEFKKKCCINNNINYVAIPYWLITQSATDTYKKIIDNIIH